MALKLNFPVFSAEDNVELAVPASLSLINTRNVEPIGYWYHLAAAVSHDISSGTYFGTKKGTGAKKDDDDDEDRDYNRGTADGKAFVKLSDEDLETDWYALLKLAAGEGATENEIRSAYRRRCLDTHPDKQPDRSDVEFKRVQRAFEILGDPNSRRAYDSSRPFDDTIPDEDLNMDEESFFSVFKPVFDRNRKWSLDTRIPKLGDARTPIKEVNRFYDAWYRFNSWRDFSHEVELEEIDEGMCREEKRFYQRENQRMLEKHKRAELKRIRTLVERAQKMDPRLRKLREAEAAAREKEKADRAAERERIRLEEVQRKAAIAEKERAEQQARQERILAERNKIKQCEADMLSFFKQNNLIEDVNTNLLQNFAVRPPNVAWLYSKVTKAEDAEQLLNSVVNDANLTPSEDKSVPVVLKFNEIIQTKEQEVGMTRYGEPIKRITPEDIAARKKAEEAKKEAQRKAASGTVWTDEDLNALQKAIAKYPGGTVDRWRKMAQMLHDKFTEDEVLTKTKDLEAQLRKGVQGPQVLASTVAPSASAPAADGSADEWSPEQQKQLENGLRELKDYKEKDKFQKVAKFVSGKTAKQCFDRFKYLCSINKKK